MKISVNIQPLLHSDKSGIGFYEAELIKAISQIDKENEYMLDFFSFKNSDEKICAASKYACENSKLNPCKWFSATLYQLIWAFFPLPYRFFFKEKADISHFYNYHVPPFARGKKVAIIYDTVIKDFPETVRFKTKMMLKLTLKRSIKRADRIVTISKFSKRQIIRHFGVSPEKIDIVPCGVNFDIFNPNYSASLVAKTAAKYNISSDYILYLGTLEPRKNIERIIEAYSLLKSKTKTSPALVLAGGKGWLYESIFEKVKALGLEENIVFTGYVPDEDVPLLMKGAMLFCFPSIYEGFGMPPLEAMACGTPVITSNNTALPEVVDDAAIQVDPYSVEKIAEALQSLVESENLRTELSKKGLAQCQKFTWENSAKKMLEIYRKLFDEKNQSSTG